MDLLELVLFVVLITLLYVLYMYSFASSNEISHLLWWNEQLFHPSSAESAAAPSAAPSCAHGWKQTWGCFYFPLLMLGNRLLWHSKVPSCMFSGHLKRLSKTLWVCSHAIFFQVFVLFAWICDLLDYSMEYILGEQIWFKKTKEKKSQITDCECRTLEHIQLAVMFSKQGVKD